MAARSTLLRGRLRTALLAGLCMALVGGILWWRNTRPSHERVWRPEQAVLPSVTFDGGRVHVRNVRDFTFRSATEFTPGYRDRTYDLDRMKRVWFGLSPFNTDWRGPAHTFLSFEFSDGQFVSVSVEARREAGEEYSIWKGLLRRFEVIYVIAEERDVIGVRAVTWKDAVYLYPAKATPDQARALFVDMMKHAQRLEREPEFYNTLWNNCTTSILEPVNRIATEKIPFGVRVVLPGYSDKLAMDHGLLDTDLPLEQARQKFQVNERAQAAIHAPDFSTRIRS